MTPGTLGQRPKAATGDRGVMDEQVLTVFIRGDEAIALVVAEPFNGSQLPCIPSWEIVCCETRRCKSNDYGSAGTHSPGSAPDQESECSRSAPGWPPVATRVRVTSAWKRGHAPAAPAWRACRARSSSTSVDAICPLLRLRSACSAASCPRLLQSVSHPAVQVGQFCALPLVVEGFGTVGRRFPGDRHGRRLADAVPGPRWP